MEIKEYIDRLDWFIKNKSDTEENLKDDVVVWLLERIGYNKDLFERETNCRKDKKDTHTDIFYPVGESGLIIETKKVSHEIDDEDIWQISDYIHQKGIQWGLITNGRMYILLNQDIDLSLSGTEGRDSLYRIVLTICIDKVKSKCKNVEYLKYLSYEKIFDNKQTYFFRDIAQYFAITGMKSGSIQYQNALYKTFNYIASKKGFYYTIPRNNVKGLEELSSQDIVDAIKNTHKVRKENQIPETQLRYIKAMFVELYKSNYIREENVTNDLLERAKMTYNHVDIEQDNPYVNILSSDAIDYILDMFIGSKNYRRIIIFTLNAYYGFPQKDIMAFYNLPWSSIDFENNTFEINGKKFDMITILRDSLELLKQEYSDNGLKKPRSIMLKKDAGKWGVPSTNTITEMYGSCIQKIEETDINWVQFTCRNVRGSLIYNMLKSGCGIEATCYFTGVSLEQITTYCSYDELVYNAQKNWKKTTKSSKELHPFGKVFDRTIK